MEIKVLDSIMHGALKPWKLDTTNTGGIVTGKQIGRAHV